MNEDILKKVKNGDGLTTDELNRATEWYKETTLRLQFLGTEFYLAWKECYFIQIRLEGFQDARRRK